MEGTTRQRLSTDARREQLLASGAVLLATRPYEEVSIEEIARTAGVSKGLLYHYFPTKKDFLIAALERGQAELAELTAPDPSLPPTEQLGASLDRFLDFVEEHAAAYQSIFRSRGGGDPEIQATLDSGRRQRMDGVIESLATWDAAPAPVERTPALETAIQGWFFFIEGAVLRWLEHRDIGRDALRELLAQTLIGALGAAESVRRTPTS
ncbi:MAG TPA: TetR/AcrR family transcriptional regulator [Solirubrobacterales bacterium]|nr:TetR/AcrR family transcriptional regulator [Solirubrobacterales bacterium]